MKRILLALLTLALANGCGTFEKVDAIFVFNNQSAGDVTFSVDGGRDYPVHGKDDVRVTIPILIPSKAVNSYSGPALVDRTTRVNIAVNNMQGDKLAVTTCVAGAKVITKVRYERTEFGYQNLWCDF